MIFSLNTTRVMRRFTNHSLPIMTKKTQLLRRKVNLESLICKSKLLKRREIPKHLRNSEANNRLFRTSTCSNKCSLTLCRVKLEMLLMLKLIHHLECQHP